MLKSNHVFANRTAPWYAVLLGVMALFFVTCSVQADTWNKKTVMTFNESVEIGGQVLPAGTYVFKLVDSPANRHIVQVLNADENHVYTTILTIPKYRSKPADETVVQFEERPSSQPQAISSWFYPGELMGEEFVSREPRTLVAKANTTTTTTAAVVTTSPIVETTPSPSVETPAPQPSQLSDAEPTPPAPFAEERVEPEPEAQPKTPETPAPAEPSGEALPKTASNLPLAGLAGLSSLCVAGVLALIRKGKA